MTAFILSTILLVSPASLQPSPPPSVVEPESGAWAVAHAGQIWVCWTPAADCFERIVLDVDAAGREHEFDDDEDPTDTDATLEPELDASEPIDVAAEAWRIGFAGPQSLWIEHGEHRFRIVRGQRRARQVDDPAPIRLARIGPAGCGPSGIVPAVIGGRLSWREAPRCAVEIATRTCVTTAGSRLRTPTPIRLRAGLEIATARAWTSAGEPERGLATAARRTTRGFELSFVIELGFDWQRRAAGQRARAVMTSLGRARVRELPKVAPGPRADAELDALARVVCGGAP